MVFGCTNTQEKVSSYLSLLQMLLGRLGLRTRDKWKGPSVVSSNFISLKIVLRWVASLLSKQKIKTRLNLLICLPLCSYYKGNYSACHLQYNSYNYERARFIPVHKAEMGSFSTALHTISDIEISSIIPVNFTT